MQRELIPFGYFDQLIEYTICDRIHNILYAELSSIIILFEYILSLPNV